VSIFPQEIIYTQDQKSWIGEKIDEEEVSEIGRSIIHLHVNNEKLK